MRLHRLPHTLAILATTALLSVALTLISTENSSSFSSSAFRQALAHTFLPTHENCLPIAAKQPPPDNTSATIDDARAPAADPNLREMAAYGTGAYLFVQLGAYRGGPDTFAVVGLASKPLHVYGRPEYGCEWESSATVLRGAAEAMLPDWGYGRVYTTVVVNCTFPVAVGADGAGGHLTLTVSSGGPTPSSSFTALTERPGEYRPPPASPYLDVVYCGSPLFGDLSPARVREWVAYHVRLLLAPHSGHLALYDAGGVHGAVRRVLEPWIRRGAVSLQDVRSQEPYDGYYHNQFAVVNDCLHRFRLSARWILFFDLDEYVYVRPPRSLQSVLHEMRGFSQFTFQQYPMASDLCLSTSNNTDLSQQWGFEKLVFKDVLKGVRRDRKYAVQPRNVFATGVHLSANFRGKTNHKTERRIGYFHYHNSINNRGEPCTRLLDYQTLLRQNKSVIIHHNSRPYRLDQTMKSLAHEIKQFELQTIGHQLAATPQ